MLGHRLGTIQFKFQSILCCFAFSAEVKGWEGREIDTSLSSYSIDNRNFE